MKAPVKNSSYYNYGNFLSNIENLNSLENKISGCFNNRNPQEAPIVLFRKRDGNSWIVVVREAEGDVKSFVKKAGSQWHPINFKGIPSKVSLENIPKAQLFFEHSRIKITDYSIEIIPILKGGKGNEEKELIKIIINRGVSAGIEAIQNACLQKTVHHKDFQKCLQNYSKTIWGKISEKKLLEENQLFQLFTRLNILCKMSHSDYRKLRDALTNAAIPIQVSSPITNITTDSAQSTMVDDISISQSSDATISTKSIQVKLNSLGKSVKNYIWDNRKAMICIGTAATLGVIAYIYYKNRKSKTLNIKVLKVIKKLQNIKAEETEKNKYLSEEIRFLIDQGACELTIVEALCRRSGSIFHASTINNSIRDPYTRKRGAELIDKQRGSLEKFSTIQSIIKNIKVKENDYQKDTDKVIEGIKQLSTDFRKDPNLLLPLYDITFAICSQKQFDIEDFIERFIQLILNPDNNVPSNYVLEYKYVMYTSAIVYKALNGDSSTIQKFAQKIEDIAKTNIEKESVEYMYFLDALIQRLRGGKPKIEKLNEKHKAVLKAFCEVAPANELQSILFDIITHFNPEAVFKGAHCVFSNSVKYIDKEGTRISYYKRWKEFSIKQKISRNKKSSHYPEVDYKQWGIDIPGFGHLLFGKRPSKLNSKIQETWFQFEKNGVNLVDKIFHVADWFRHVSNDYIQIGPHGEIYASEKSKYYLSDDHYGDELFAFNLIGY